MQAWQFTGRGIGRQTLHDVLDHHYGGIDQHTDCNSQTTQAHQVRRHAEGAHQDERDQRRQRKHQGDSQCRAEVAQKQPK